MRRDQVQIGANESHQPNRETRPGPQRRLPADEVEARASQLLPDKDAAIVTYCSNPACQNSTQVAVKLEQLGYRDVGKYAAGIQDWVEAGLPTSSGVPAFERITTHG